MPPGSICRRSALLRRVAGRGAMAVVELDVDAAGDAVAAYEGRLSMAVVNSPTSTVVAGDPDALDALMAELSATDVFARRVKVDVASHSPQVEGLLDELVADLAGIRPVGATIPFWSTVTDRFEDGPGLDAGYWARNLRDPVQFWSASQALAARGHTCAVEISPHPVLVPAVQEALADGTEGGTVVASLRRDSDEPAELAAAVGALYVAGVDIAWDCYHGDRAPVLDLPTYPWQHERFWVAPPTGSGGRRGAPDDAVLGYSVPAADPTLPAVWEGEIPPDEPGPVPAATTAELMARAAATIGANALANATFLPVATDGSPTPIQMVLDRHRGTVSVHVAGDGGWRSRPKPRSTRTTSRPTGGATVPGPGRCSRRAGAGRRRRSSDRGSGLAPCARPVHPGGHRGGRRDRRHRRHLDRLGADDRLRRPTAGHRERHRPAALGRGDGGPGPLGARHRVAARAARPRGG